MTAAAGAAIVDLSLPIRTGMTVFPGDPEVVVEPALTIARDGVDVLRLHLGSQSGTHVDAPSHVLPDGPGLDELPLDRFLGPAVLADLRHLGPEAEIGWDDLEPVRGRLRPGVILVLHTGWSAYVEDPERYRAHPWLGAEAARRIAQAGVRTVGIDALNVDATPSDLSTIRFDAHRELLGVGAVIVENLTGLERLAHLADPILSVLPLRIPGADGAPVRAVAIDRGFLAGTQRP
jgi:kynurenine formamidase